MNYFMEDPDLFLEEPIYDTREMLQEVLGDDAHYLKLNYRSKKPAGSYKDISDRLSTIPKRGNFGVIPVKRLFILDFDLHRSGSASIKEQLDFFSDFLEEDLSQTLSIVTQTGGLHIYLKFPWSVNSSIAKNLPKASLRGYSKAFSEIAGREIKLDADIRSGLVNGYVVGPTSRVNKSELTNEVLHDTYWVADESVGFNRRFDFPKPIMITSQAVKKLEKVVLFKKSLQQKRSQESKNRKEIKIGERVLSESFPSEDTIRILQKNLSIRDNKSFHAQRAFIKSALHCCYSDTVIAQVCESLKINKDSFTGDLLTLDTLLIDISNFNPSEVFHSIYCLKENSFSKNNYSWDIDKITLKSKEKVSERKISRRNPNFKRKINPRVIDPVKVYSALRESQKYKQKDSQQVRDAFSLVENCLQPLANVGAQRIVLSQNFIQENLEVSASRSSAALRLLRKLEIIRLYDKQKTGLAPTYLINEDYISQDLTVALRKTWGSLFVEDIEDFHPSLIFDSRELKFKDALTKNSVWQTPLYYDPNILPEKDQDFKFKVIFQYLKEERELRTQEGKILDSFRRKTIDF